MWLYLWQLPQHILGLLIWAVLKHYIVAIEKTPENTFLFVNIPMGVSLGRYIIMSRDYGENTRKHEQGHSVQSRRLGPLYLLVIGLPSFLGNIWDRLFKKGSQ